jgi:hypothetical protein
MATLSTEQVMALIQELQSVKLDLEQLKSQQQQASVAAAAPPQAPPQPAALKPAQPDTFDGSKYGNSVDTWLFQFEQYFKACRRHNDEGVAYAGSLLRGAASTWWRQRQLLIQSGAKSDITTWDEFRAELRTQFSLINARSL